MTLYTEQKGEGSEARSPTIEAGRRSLYVRRAPEVGLPPAGSKTFARPRLQDPSLLVQKSASRYRLRRRFRILTSNHIPPFPDREPLGLFPRPATPLRPATFNASSFEDASHIAKQIRLALQDQRAGSSPSGARSDGESTHAESEDQVLFDARAKKISKKFASDPLNEISRSDRSDRSRQNDRNDPNGSNDPNDGVCYACMRVASASTMILLVASSADAQWLNLPTRGASRRPTAKRISRHPRRRHPGMERRIPGGADARHRTA
jgi:hypothetical protein